MQRLGKKNKKMRREGEGWGGGGQRWERKKKMKLFAVIPKVSKKFTNNICVCLCALLHIGPKSFCSCEKPSFRPSIQISDF